MALTRVQAKTAVNTTFASTVTTAAITTTSGNCVLVAWEGDTVALNGGTMSDNKSNTWTRAVSRSKSGTFEFEIWYALNITGGASHTFTVADNGGGVDSIIAIEEWSGVATVTALDKSTITDDGGSAGLPNSGAMATTTNANDIIWGGMVQGSAGVISLGSGYSNLSSAATAFSTVAIESKVVAATGAYSADFGSTLTNQSWVCGVVAMSDTAIAAGASHIGLSALGVG